MSTQKRPGLIWAWVVLLIAGANQLLWNLWHAFALQMPGPLALALGAGPVLLAITTSALATRVRAGFIHRALTYGVMLSAIGLSIWAQFELLMLFTRSALVAVLFPAVGDLAVLIALHTLISGPPGERTGTRRPGWLVRRSVRTVPAAPLEGAAADRTADRSAGASPAVPLEKSVPAADRTAERSAPAARTERVPAEQTGTKRVADRSTRPVETESVPAARTDAVPVRTESVPAVRTEPVPAADRSAGRSTSRSAGRVPTRSVPAVTSPKDGDQAALERLDRAFAGVDPAEVSIGMVRKELDGAGFARGKRLHGLWLARTASAGRSSTGEAGADRTADRSTDRAGTDEDDRAGTPEQTGTPAPEQTGTKERAEEAERAPVPA